MTLQVRVLLLICAAAFVYVVAFDFVLEHQRGDWKIYGLPCSDRDSRAMLVDRVKLGPAHILAPANVTDATAKVCVSWKVPFAWHVRFPTTGDRAKVTVTPENEFRPGAARDAQPVQAWESKRTPSQLLIAQILMIFCAAVFIYRLVDDPTLDPDRVVRSIAIYLICQSVSITYEFGLFAAVTSMVMPLVIFAGFGYFLDFTGRFESASSAFPGAAPQNRYSAQFRAARASIARYGLKGGIVVGIVFSIAAGVRLWLNYDIPWSSDAYRFLQPVLGSYLPLVALLLGFFTAPKGVRLQLLVLFVGFAFAVSGPIQYDNVMRSALEAPTDARAMLWTLIGVPIAVIVEIEVLHIFKLPHVASRQLAAVGVTVVLFVPFVVLETIGHNFMGDLTKDVAVQAVIAILIVLPMRSLHERILHWARSKFAGGAPALHACAHDVLTSTEASDAIIAHAMQCVCTAVNADFAALYRNVDGRFTPLGSSRNAVRAPRAFARPALKSVPDRHFGHAGKRWTLADAPGAAVVPVAVRADVRWVLVCGPRKERAKFWSDQEAYSPDELAALHALAHNLALFLHC